MLIKTYWYHKISPDYRELMQKRLWTY